MTRLKKELVKKTNSATNERIKRIKDQKKVVNSKNNVKISEFHVKRLLESVENDSDASAASFMNDNNNGLQSNVSIFTKYQDHGHYKVTSGLACVLDKIHRNVFKCNIREKCKICYYMME